jgi:enterochelin esterase-like enzyme
VRKNSFLLILLLVSALACNEEDDLLTDHVTYHEFTSYSDFMETFLHISEMGDAAQMESFLDSLELHHQIPFSMNDSVAFLYQGTSSSVMWVGDFNGWSTSAGYSGTKIDNTDVWMAEKVFPSDARLDYKIIVDGNWLLDPRNSFIQYSGFGPNSELRMPEWEYPMETILGEGVVRGQLSENFTIQSQAANLNYTVQYRVYTPAEYNVLSDLPVIYVTDGHEYSNEVMGSMLTVLDNLIFNETIQPIIAVFIDPRNPSNLSENRRGSQYTGNIKFANFVADELVPVIDAAYKTNSNPTARAILGTSLGGWNSAFFGLERSDVFQLIAIHSPAFSNDIIQSYFDSPLLPLKVFMSTGVIYDTEDQARAMKEVMDQKEYPILYKEVNEGHSWGNWRALIEEPLVYFFAN